MKYLSLYGAALAAGVLLNSQGAAAMESMGKIYPQAQSAEGEVIAIPIDADRVTIQFYGDELPQSYSVAEMLYRRVLDKLPKAKSGKQLTIHGGLVADAKVAALLQGEKLLLPSQGYAIRQLADSADGPQILIAASDPQGLVYGFASLAQLLEKTEDGAVQKVQSVTDYPEWRHRFVSDYSTNFNREALVEALGYKVSSAAMIVQSNWRDPAWWEKMKDSFAAIKEFSANGTMEFMALPHLYSQPKTAKQMNIANDDEVQELIEVCRRFAETGFTHIMIGADDLTPAEFGVGYVPFHQEEVDKFGSIGTAHGVLMRRLYDALHEEYPGLTLSMVGAPYSLGHGIGRPEIDQYVEDWGKAAPKEVRWVWTGKWVFSPEVNSNELREMTDLLSGQDVYLFDNSNGFFAPLPRWETKFYPTMEVDNRSLVYLNGTFFWNQCRNEETLRFLTSCDYLWNPGAYQAKESYDTAIAMLFGQEVVEPVNALRDMMVAYDKAEFTGERTGLPTAAEFEAAYQRVEALNNAGNNLASALRLDRIKPRVERAKTFEAYHAPELDVPAGQGEITVDGVFDEAAWNGAQSFTLTNNDLTKTTPATTGKICHANGNIYLALTIPCETELPAGKTMEMDEPAFASEDAVELFFQFVPQSPTNIGAYAHYCFDFSGNCFDEGTSGGSGLEWNGDWDVATQRNGKGWTAEVRIRPTPVFRSERVMQMEDTMYFVDLLPGAQPSPVEPGNVYLANFHRVENRTNTVQSWGKGGFTFHLPGYFGKLKLTK